MYTTPESSPLRRFIFQRPLISYPNVLFQSDVGSMCVRHKYRVLQSVQWHCETRTVGCQRRPKARVGTTCCKAEDPSCRVYWKLLSTPVATTWWNASIRYLLYTGTPILSTFCSDSVTCRWKLTSCKFTPPGASAQENKNGGRCVRLSFRRCNFL